MPPAESAVLTGASKPRGSAGHPGRPAHCSRPDHIGGRSRFAEDMRRVAALPRRVLSPLPSPGGGNGG